MVESVTSAPASTEVPLIVSVVASTLPNEPVEVAEPLMFPELSTITGLEYGPNRTSLSLKASITGNPAIVFALKIEPLISSVMLNNLPCVPSTLRSVDPEPSIPKL